jgi:hypothetical protein
MRPRTAVYGLLGEFDTPLALRKAARRAWRAGYRDLDAYSPYAVEGLGGDLGLRRTRIPFVVLMAAVVGAAVGYFMQFWTMGVDYPFDVGGRPYHSWPVWIPITFEVMVLVSGVSALLAMLFLNGLPRLHHPLFNVGRFARASQDAFFLCIEATDPKFDRVLTRQFLTSLGAKDVAEVPH